MSNGAMDKAFEKISGIETLMAAAFVSPLNQMLGWCANTAIAPEKLLQIGEICRSTLGSLRADHYEARVAAIAFGKRTLVVREYSSGIFIAYLDSPVNDEVLQWLWDQVDSLLVG